MQTRSIYRISSSSTPAMDKENEDDCWLVGDNENDLVSGWIEDSMQTPTTSCGQLLGLWVALLTWMNFGKFCVLFYGHLHSNVSGRAFLFLDRIWFCGLTTVVMGWNACEVMCRMSTTTAVSLNTTRHDNHKSGAVVMANKEPRPDWLPILSHRSQWLGVVGGNGCIRA